MRHTRACLLWLGLLGVGCTGEPETPLDPDVPPVTTGNWYQPGVATTWQWQLLGTVNTGYDVELYDIDLFDSSAAAIADLHAAGRKVICYFSAGSSEDWRPDFGDLGDEALGNPLDGWAGERWLDIRLPSVHAVMQRRLDLAVSQGCDGVEPDNVDGFANDTGFSLSARDQLAFNRFIANEARGRGLAVGLKNDGDQAAELVAYYDFALNEECHAFNECAVLAPFSAAAKPIFNAEYAATLPEAQSRATGLCAAALAASLRTLILPLALDDSFRVSCD